MDYIRVLGDLPLNKALYVHAVGTRMKFEFCCSECNHIFELKDALCEDWSDPKKSFICPNCKTALVPWKTKDYLSFRKTWTNLGTSIGLTAFLTAFFTATARALDLVTFLVLLAVVSIPLIYLVKKYLPKSTPYPTQSWITLEKENA